MTRRLIITIVLLQGCAYTVPVGKDGTGTVKRSQIDKLAESGDYHTDPKKVISPPEKGFYKMKPVKPRPECNSEVTPGSASNFSNCR